MQKNFEACEAFTETQTAASYHPGKGSNYLMSSNLSLLVQAKATFAPGCQI